jgi:hypothetical protein
MCLIRHSQWSGVNWETKMAFIEGTLAADSEVGTNSEDQILMRGAFDTNPDFNLDSFIWFNSDDLALAGFMNEFAQNFALADITDGEGGDDVIILEDSPEAPNLVCDGRGDDLVTGSNTADWVWLQEDSNSLDLRGGNDIVRISYNSSAGSGTEISNVNLGAGADTVWVSWLPEEFNAAVVVRDFNPAVDAIVFEEDIVDAFLDGDVEISFNAATGYTEFELDGGGSLFINGTVDEILSAAHFPNLDTDVWCLGDFYYNDSVLLA